MKTVLGLTIAILLLTSCSGEKEELLVVNSSAFRDTLLTKSTDTLTFMDNRYILEAELWRDFFPEAFSMRKHPLIAVVTLVNSDSSAVSPSLRVLNFYVINGTKVWVAEPGQVTQHSTPAYKLQKQHNYGPYWDTGIMADVVLQLNDKTTNRTFFLKRRNVMIARLD